MCVCVGGDPENFFLVNNIFQGGASFVDHLCYLCLIFINLFEKKRSYNGMALSVRPHVDSL